ncbi:MAG: hypothetical protein E6Q36_07445 [Chryseobacterium sp.]|nr:MAG: hypothetical protein E6Q36_07445 [Chryseobacterium sp.]
MKKIVITGTLLIVALFARSQNQTIKLYLKQIAANKVYIEYLQKGYRIAKAGLTTIGNIKNGHYRLDKNFFGALENVNPAIKNYAKIADIIALNIRLIKNQAEALKQAEKSEMFTNDEKEYISSVFSKTLNSCTDLIDELTLVLSESKLKMSDDERIARIDLIHKSLQDCRVFSNSFSSEISILALQRAKETNSIERVKLLYGLK